MSHPGIDGHAKARLNTNATSMPNTVMPVTEAFGIIVMGLIPAGSWCLAISTMFDPIVTEASNKVRLTSLSK